MTSYLTLLGTVLNKQTRQLFGIVTRMIKSLRLPRLPVDNDPRYERQIPDEFTPVVEPIRENTVQLQESTASRREGLKNKHTKNIRLISWDVRKVDIQYRSRLLDRYLNEPDGVIITTIHSGYNSLYPEGFMRLMSGNSANDTQVMVENHYWDVTEIEV